MAKKGNAKKILTAAGVAAATAGLAVAVTKQQQKKKKGGGSGAKVYHVTPQDDGWAVKAEGADRAVSRHSNKKDAVAAGREVAKAQAPSQLVIHGTDGAIQRSHEYEAE